MSATSSRQSNAYVEPLDPRQIAIYRRMTGEQLLRIGFEMCDAVRELTLAGIRYRHPGASEAETRRLLRQSYEA